MVIRSATEADLDDVLSVERDAFGEDIDKAVTMTDVTLRDTGVENENN